MDRSLRRFARDSQRFDGCRQCCSCRCEYSAPLNQRARLQAMPTMPAIENHFQVATMRPHQYESAPISRGSLNANHPLGLSSRATILNPPDGAFTMVGRDDSASGWFAFKEPREMGALSYWCGRMVATWKWFSIAGIVGMAWSLARWFSGAEYSQRQEQH